MVHRLPSLPGGRPVQSRFLCVVRTVSYLFFATAGLLLLLSPVVAQAYGEWVTALSWFILIGGTGAAAGAATRRWAGEFIGLPLLASGFLAFGVEAWAQSHHEAPYLAVANLALLAGLSGLLAARWRMVLAIFHMALAAGRLR